MLDYLVANHLSIIGIAISLTLGIPQTRTFLMGLRNNNNDKKIAALEANIEDINQYVSGQKNFVAAMFAEIFFIAIFLAITAFSGFLMVLKANFVMNAVLFFFTWGFSILLIGRAFDIAIQMKDPARSIERLRNKIEQLRR